MSMCKDIFAAEGNTDLGDKMKKKIAPIVPDWPIAPGCSLTDPMGSYTGVPNDPEDTPIQDADDL